jgi:glycerol-3-phosphate O-acyltransferase
MGRLGAYKVDRRKKNAIYRATLDTYSTRAISHNVHSLFFPGGTRSRTGTIEKRLKLGLLGTAVEAQRLNLLPGGSGKKVFVVPMVMSYHFVLEAKTLINQHLKRTGQDKYYILRDEFASYRKILMFVWKTFGKTSEITLNFGKPMDLFGNFVDNEGNSYDAAGKELNIREYFMSGGEMKEDKQRDEQYTRMLGDKIVERYHAENHVFSSHLVAFVAFEMLKKRYARFDLYALLRLPQDERTLAMKAYLEKLTTVLDRLREMRDQEKVMLAEHMEASAMDIIRHGIKNLGLYHDKRPLSFVKGGDLISENMNLLYYYHNRLEGYGLEKYI